MSKWVKSFDHNASPIVIQFFPSKEIKVKALIEDEIERKKESERNREKYRHSYTYEAV